MNTSRVSAFVGWAAILLVAFAALSANAFAAGMPVQWNPNQVAVSPDDNNSFLLRPGQILVCPGDAAVVHAHQRQPLGQILAPTVHCAGRLDAVREHEAREPPLRDGAEVLDVDRVAEAHRPS